MRFGLLRTIGTGAGAGLLALLVASPGLAQDATPMPGMGMGDGGTPHPAHIHVGNCATLDPNPAFPLADVIIPAAEMDAGDEAMGEASPVTDASPMASPMTGPMGTGSPAAIPAGQSTTVIEVGLSDILAVEHAINVHLSYEDPGTYVACGAIGGAVDANGNLFVGLMEQNESGYSGIAWLHDNGDGTTTVTIFLAMGLHGADAVDGGDMDATPAA